ncbi:MAG: type II secretion system F family protein [Actinomycetota bacterium]
MPKYSYDALDGAGNRVGGTVTADTEGLAVESLRATGLRPLKVKPKLSLLQFELTPEKVKPAEIMHFSRQLGVFIKAGIPIMEALTIIASETMDKQLRKVLNEMIESLYDGQTFAAAVAEHPNIFPNYYVGILQSAELTGNLDEVLRQLADYIQRDIDAKSQFTGALIYPGVVLAMAIVVVVVLCAFVLPRFRAFFGQLGAKLPLPTRMMLGFSSLVSTYWWLILLVTIGVVVGFITAKRTPAGKALLDSTMLKVPVLGGLIRASIVERLCRVLASMIDSGVPLPDAMTVAADCANNLTYKRGMQKIREEMMEGRGIAAPLAETGLFPTAAQQMFRVGEETGSLNLQMETAADYYKRELDLKIKHFTSLFEPAVIVFVGVVVGFVAVALVTAMYGVYNQVH